MVTHITPGKIYGLSKINNFCPEKNVDIQHFKNAPIKIDNLQQFDKIKIKIKNTTLRATVQVKIVDRKERVKKT